MKAHALRICWLTLSVLLLCSRGLSQVVPASSSQNQQILTAKWQQTAHQLGLDVKMEKIRILRAKRAAGRN